MRILTSCALALSAVALLALAATASAVTITPAGTGISGSASNPTLTYGGVTIKCDTGLYSGTTTNPASASVDLTLTFSNNCKVGLLSANNVTCGTVKFTASGIATSGTFRLNSGLTCSIVVPNICEITVSGSQTPGDLGTLNEAATTLTSTINTLSGTRTGSASCGPASSTTASFTASWNVLPTTVAIT